MKYVIEADHQHQILRVTYQGHITLDQRIAVLTELSIDWRNYLNGATPLRVLIDARGITNVLSDNEQQLLGKFIAQRDEFRGAKVAVFVEQGQVVNRLLLESATTNGLHHLLTSSETQAITWLTS